MSRTSIKRPIVVRRSDFPSEESFRAVQELAYAVRQIQLELGQEVNKSLVIEENLADLASAATARANLGLASGATTTVGTAAPEDVGKTIGDIPQYEDDGSGNPVIDHPNMPFVGGLKLGGIGDFAWKEGPVSISTAYKVTWDAGGDVGASLDAAETADGIRVKKTGYYRVSYWQRTSNTTSNPYGGIAEDGDRSVLENRTTGAWFHDHAADGANNACKSYYLGLLNAGELITAGESSSTAGELAYGTAGFYGNIQVFRIR